MLGIGGCIAEFDGMVCFWQKANTQKRNSQKAMVEYRLVISENEKLGRIPS